MNLGSGRLRVDQRLTPVALSFESVNARVVFQPEVLSAKNALQRLGRAPL